MFRNKKGYTTLVPFVTICDKNVFLFFCVSPSKERPTRRADLPAVVAVSARLLLTDVAQQVSRRQLGGRQGLDQFQPTLGLGTLIE